MRRILALIAAVSLAAGCEPVDGEAELTATTEAGLALRPAISSNQGVLQLPGRALVALRPEPQNVAFQGWWSHPNQPAALHIVGDRAQLFIHGEACELAIEARLDGASLVDDEGEQINLSMVPKGLRLSGTPRGLLNATYVSTDAPSGCAPDNSLRGGLDVPQMAAALMGDRDD